jgi:adenylate kinase family enzyme
MWEPGWIQPPVEVQRERMARICEAGQWVIDSAYATWIDIPLESVQLVICLDYPRWISFTRLLRRTFSRTMKRSVVCNGNVETMRRTLSRDSILIWHFKSFARKRARMRSWARNVGAQRNPGHAQCRDAPLFQVLVFHSPRQARKWLDEVVS